jgi:hypothetical protein
VVLNLLQVVAETRESGGFRLIAQRDERLERRLVVEPLVLVHLVRPYGRLDAGVELHPRDVAVVVVIADERRRALLEECLERRLSRERRRIAKQRRHLRKLPLVLEAVRHRGQRAVWRAANRREEPFGTGPFHLR